MAAIEIYPLTSYILELHKSSNIFSSKNSFSITETNTINLRKQQLAKFETSRDDRFAKDMFEIICNYYELLEAKSRTRNTSHYKLMQEEGVKAAFDFLSFGELYFINPQMFYTLYHYHNFRDDKYIPGDLKRFITTKENHIILRVTNDPELDIFLADKNDPQPLQTKIPNPQNLIISAKNYDKEEAFKLIAKYSTLPSNSIALIEHLIK